MKKNMICISLLTTLALASLTTTSAFAAEMKGQTQDTPVTVGITDDDTPVDPINPDDPTQQDLVLKAVPKSYQFTSGLKDITYSLKSSLKGENITIFNNRADRSWSVRATVKGNKISKDATDFPVSSFKINSTELAGTGASGIVAKSADTKTADNNTGTLSTAVTSAGIDFTDSTGVLKAGDTVTGTISYQLYDTADAS